MAMMKGHKFPGGRSVMPTVPSSPPKSKMTESINIRPIENGYLIEKSTYGDKNGKYFSESKTTYSPTKPKL